MSFVLHKNLRFPCLIRATPTTRPTTTVNGKVFHEKVVLQRTKYTDLELNLQILWLKNDITTALTLPLGVCGLNKFSVLFWIYVIIIQTHSICSKKTTSTGWQILEYSFNRNSNILNKYVSSLNMWILQIFIFWRQSWRWLQKLFEC